MAHDRLTRRMLIAAGAGAGVAGLLAPAGAWAEDELASSHMWTQAPGSLTGAPVSIRVARRADLVGVQWEAPSAPHIELRARVDGRWGAWAHAAATGHGPDAAARQRIGDPIWTGGADELQLRASAPVRGVRLHLVDVSGGRGARVLARAPGARGAALRAAEPILAAGPGQPPIVARESWALGRCPPAGPPDYGDVELAFVHHTENPNGYLAGEVPAMLRAIFVFHRYARGWRDIGYNFVVDRFGRAFEARTGGIDEPVLGAHAGGYNVYSTGIAVLGDFVAAPVSPAALATLQRLVAWKLSLHGRPVTGSAVVHVDPSGAVYSRFPARAAVRLPRVAGHRDADSTDCPGDALYRRLPDIRRAAHMLAGPVLRATLLGPRTPVLAGGPVALSGDLAQLDGSPVATAAIAVQGRRRPTDPPGPREVTLAQVTTAADGTWTLGLPLTGDISLRALFAGAPGLPAAVSDPLDVAVAPQLSLSASPAQPAVGQPVTLSGTLVPAKARVELDVWRLRPDGSRTAPRRLRLLASRGTFSTTFTPSQAATYQCVARTAADAVSAPGRSPVLSVVAASPPAPAPPAAMTPAPGA